MIHLRPPRQENGEENGEEAGGGNEVGEEPSGEAAQEEEEEEEEAVRGRKDPAEPSRDERARHELTHVPFRPWCRHCVSGKRPTIFINGVMNGGRSPRSRRPRSTTGSSSSTARRRTASSWSSRRRRVVWWAPGA